MISPLIFFRTYGAPILAGLLALGLGLGFWLYVAAIGRDLRAARAALAVAETTIVDLQAVEAENSRNLGYAAGRLDAETELAQERLAGAKARADAAASRTARLSGELDALRVDLEKRQADCGIGPDLTQRLLDDRAAREADRKRRIGAD